MPGFWTTLGNMKFKSVLPFIGGMVLGFLLALYFNSSITYNELNSLLELIINAFSAI